MDNSTQSKKALVIQGGAFRTAFSAGVLDVFLQENFTDFQIYAGVSGGANSLSYFLSGQERKCLESMLHLAEDAKPKLNRLVRSRTLLDLDFFNVIAHELVPFDFNCLERDHPDKKIGIVLTNRLTGKPTYIHPTPENWVDCCIASCTLPFITKGKHELFGEEFMDGSWSDPLPVKWAIEQGATEVFVVRTAPAYLKEKKSVPNRVGEIYFRNNPSLKMIFANDHINYNNAIDYIAENPKGVKIHQVAPEKILLTNRFTNMKESIEKDYQYGREKGNEFLSQF